MRCRDSQGLSSANLGLFPALPSQKLQLPKERLTFVRNGLVVRRTTPRTQLGSAVTFPTAEAEAHTPHHTLPNGNSTSRLPKRKKLYGTLPGCSQPGWPGKGHTFGYAATSCYASRRFFMILFPMSNTTSLM